MCGFRAGRTLTTGQLAGTTTTRTTVHTPMLPSKSSKYCLSPKIFTNSLRAARLQAPAPRVFAPSRHPCGRRKRSVYAYASQVGVCAGISAHVCMARHACSNSLVGTVRTVHLSVHMCVSVRIDSSSRLFIVECLQYNPLSWPTCLVSSRVSRAS